MPQLQRGFNEQQWFGQSRGFIPFAVVESEPPIPEMPNVEKLSLPANTPVGTQVSVTDGFVANVDGASLLFVANGTFGGGVRYERIPNPSTGDQCVYDSGYGTWYLHTESSDIPETNEISAPCSPSVPPWEADWSGANVPVVFTHPAIQELVAPSTAQGGVFVSGGAQDGICYKGANSVSGKDAYFYLGENEIDYLSSVRWSDDLIGEVGAGPSSPGWAIQANNNDSSLLYYSLSDVATPDLVVEVNPVFTIDFNNLTVTGAHDYGLYAQGSPSEASLITINADDATQLADSQIDFGGGGGVAFIIHNGDSPTKQQIINKLVALGGGKITDLGGLVIRVSPTDRALTPIDFSGMTGSGYTTTPKGWNNASDDSPANITVTSIPQGELDAGVTVAGAGNSIVNGPHLVSGNALGNNTYGKVGVGWELNSEGLENGGGEWDYWHLGEAYYSHIGITAFPWGLVFGENSGTPPAPTVTRNDVASEANWEVVL